VIDAYNRDLPYDRFVTLQIAGDEMTNATAEDRIATGFYRNTMTNRESGVDPHERASINWWTAWAPPAPFSSASRCAVHRHDPIRSHQTA